MAGKAFGDGREAGFWWAMMLLSVGVGLYALALVGSGFRFVPPQIAANTAAFPVGLPVHAAAAAFALILGPFQFRRGLRGRRPRLHRWMGRGYVAACVVGGISGGSIALGTDAGPAAGWGFLLLAIAWVAATAMAWRCALGRDFAAHERWMVRSFALSLAAVTLRIYVPLGYLAGLEPYAAYRIIAWACWAPNLLVAELWLSAKRRASQAA